MNSKQEIKLTMYLSANGFMVSHLEETKDLPDFTKNLDEFGRTISDIQSVAEVQKTDKKGLTVQKRVFREKLRSDALDASFKLNAFARFTGNIPLQSEVSMTKSKLNRATDTGLRDYARIIYDRAQASLNELAPYGITSSTQEQFLNAIENYNASISGPRLGITEKTQATDLLTAYFEKADLLLDNLDAAIGIIRLSNPQFVNGYESARRLVTTGKTYMSLKALAVDLLTGALIQGANFSFVHNGNGNGSANGKFMKKTADKGIFFLKNIPEGIYQVKISKPGYKEKETSVVISDSKMAELKVELEKA